MIFFWGVWRGTERLLWHPRGGYVRPAEALPARLAHRLAAGVESTMIWTGAWEGGEESWTLLPVAAGDLAGTFLSPGKLTAQAMRAAARREFRLLPGIEALLGEGKE